MGMENEFMINTAMLLEYLLAYLYVYFAHSVFSLYWKWRTFISISSNSPLN